MISNSEIRARARVALGGKIFGSPWLYPLVVSLICAAINSALSFTGIGTLIVFGLLSVASAGYYLSVVRSPEAYRNFGTCVDSAKTDIGGNIITGILHTLFIMLWSLLFVIPGIVKACSYAMTFYIKAENPNLTATEAITESRKMMDGHKLDYFFLQLSFIGWYIVGAICLGIGVLWVNTYREASNAIFYEHIKGVPTVEIPHLDTPDFDSKAE